MKATRALPLLLVWLVSALIAFESAAQRDNSSVRESPNAGVTQTLGTTEIEVTYGRPGVKEREIFGGLQPWGQVWRAGANEPTTLTFSGPVEIEGERLEEGTYNLFIRPNEDGPWDVILTTPVRWGTMFDEATPVLEVQANPTTAPAQEWLSYTFEDLSESRSTLVMRWDEVALPIEISVADAGQD